MAEQVRRKVVVDWSLIMAGLALIVSAWTYFGTRDSEDRRDRTRMVVDATTQGAQRLVACDTALKSAHAEAMRVAGMLRGGYSPPANDTVAFLSVLRTSLESAEAEGVVAGVHLQILDRLSPSTDTRPSSIHDEVDRIVTTVRMVRSVMCEGDITNDPKKGEQAEKMSEELGRLRQLAAKAIELVATIARRAIQSLPGASR